MHHIAVASSWYLAGVSTNAQVYSVVQTDVVGRTDGPTDRREMTLTGADVLKADATTRQHRLYDVLVAVEMRKKVKVAHTRLPSVGFRS